jgi:Asp-tRNA(Asn)/Glu-tRNA(Gln) amidotransferase A subunit family amidase
MDYIATRTESPMTSALGRPPIPRTGFRRAFPQREPRVGEGRAWLRGLLMAFTIAWVSGGCSAPAAAPPPGPAASPSPSQALHRPPDPPRDTDALDPDFVAELCVQQIQADYQAGRYTAGQLTQAFLDRIHRYEGHYNAFISLNPEALREAEALDAEYRETGPRGPLHGVPVVVKDNMDMAGLVTTVGFRGFSRDEGGVPMIPDRDAAAVARLRQAGAIILGKTNLPDFAGHGTRTHSSVAGVTLNPYNTAKAPGGSSGGTATAVNASFAVLGLGTETGGSIQNPAGAQALVGVKPTYGLVPLKGVFPMDATYVDVVGPLARTVRDAAIALDVLAGPTLEDLATFASQDHIPAEGYAAGLRAGALKGRRFGLVGTGWRDGFLPLAPETEAHYRVAIEILRAQGAEVVEDPFEGSGFVDLYGERPRGGRSGSYDMHLYLQGLGPGAAFRSIEEWEDLTGETFRGSGQRRPPPLPGQQRQVCQAGEDVGDQGAQGGQEDDEGELVHQGGREVQPDQGGGQDAGDDQPRHRRPPLGHPAEDAGKRPSRATANGICPWSRIHPFRAPKALMAAPMAMKPPPTRPRSGWRRRQRERWTGQLAGRHDPHDPHGGQDVDQGGQPGSQHRGPGYGASGIPHRIGGDGGGFQTQEGPERQGGGGGDGAEGGSSGGVEGDEVVGIQPEEAQGSHGHQGSSFRIVVQSWTMPASLTPRAFTPVRSQMAAQGGAGPRAGSWAREGKKVAE